MDKEEIRQNVKDKSALDSYNESIKKISSTSEKAKIYILHHFSVGGIKRRVTKDKYDKVQDK